jgi:hypothetical protein
MRDAFAYLDEYKATHQGKQRPVGINGIHEVVGILPRQKNIKQNQYPQEEKKGFLQQCGISPQVFYGVQYTHG